MTVKRTFDVLVAVVGLIISAPVWLVVALAIKVTSRGPVLFRATRVGRGGEPFTLLKFRTMRAAGGDHAGVTAAGDPRITAVGRLLRLTKLDELPQLVNVLRGEMSLVGPRPEDPRYVAGYTPEQRRVLTVLPGITSPAAITYRHEEQLLRASVHDLERAYAEEVLPLKLALDLAYVDGRSFWGDLGVLLRTAAAIVRRGAEGPAGP